MTHYDPAKLARELTSEQFELLIRFRIAIEREALAPKAPRTIMLHVREEEVNWLLGNSYDEGYTKGELLHDCITECNRRLGFVASNKLRLIEAPAATPPSEVPF